MTAQHHDTSTLRRDLLRTVDAAATATEEYQSGAPVHTYLEFEYEYDYIVLPTESSVRYGSVRLFAPHRTINDSTFRTKRQYFFTMHLLYVNSCAKPIELYKKERASPRTSVGVFISERPYRPSVGVFTLSR